MCTPNPRYLEAVAGSRAELVAPLRRKGRVIGALNLLSDTAGSVTEIDEMISVSSAPMWRLHLENARLFEQERDYRGTLETLSDVAPGIRLDPQSRRAPDTTGQPTRRVIDYRTFGILLLDDATQELEMKVAVRYGNSTESPRVKMGSGIGRLCGPHKEVACP